MALQRPAWTIVFGLCWLLCIVGTIMTHVALVNVIPSIKDLPDNLVKGFGEVFKFAYLKADSEEVQKAATDALKMAGIMPSQCPTVTGLPLAPTAVDTSAEKQRIQTAFANSLAKINVIAHDKYLGTGALQDQAANLDRIVVDLGKVDASSSKSEARVAYCSIFQSANLIVDGVGEVDKQIDKFRNSDAMKKFVDNADKLDLIHALPYVMILSLIFFSIFWLRGGVCPCCRGGTYLGCLFLVPHALLWLVFFIISVVIVAAGIGVKYFSNEVTVDELKGKPNAEEVIDHIQQKFPEFWSTVFKDMAAGLDQWWIASIVFVVFCLLIALYACCTCCCRPYQKLAEVPEQLKAQPAPEESKEQPTPEEPKPLPAPEEPKAQPAAQPAPVAPPPAEDVSVAESEV